MPIYAYRCTSCGHAQDVLQKISDPVLTVCPACGTASYAKQLTAAGFQLKGSGWYVTDFRGGKKPEGETAKPGEPAGGKPADAPAPAPSTTDAKPAPAPAPAAAAPAPSPSSGTSSGS
ncbi:MAG: zinc ribbon domain-containing protein [Rubrivivax sp.]|nr:zinc ribbon domain-containing protein [Rubrivivax sp.]